MRKMLLTIVAGAGFACAFAEVKLATPFADGMVLQRDAKTAVWGTADAGERVTVSFAGQSVSATADAEGRWLVRLAPMAASKEGRTLRANGVEVKDVLGPFQTSRIGTVKDEYGNESRGVVGLRNTNINVFEEV